ncbi:MAG: APC family permease, partial [Desulfobacteria bacterium]
GGIFSVLGVVILVAGQWAWLSFAIGGLIALATAYGYSCMSNKYRECGGSFSYLRQCDQKGFAGNLAWVLILGYTLTISVYGFTFGHYLAHVTGFGPWFPRLCALAIIGGLTYVNLIGIRETVGVEILTVWGKVIILLILGMVGLLFFWEPEQLSAGIELQGIHMAFVGAAAVFMAYEGFQLLAYDYHVIRNPRKTFPRAVMGAVVVVIVIYIIVTLGATMIVGAGEMARHPEVALSLAGEAAMGLTGLILVTIGALFSTASAINATLFATARLTQEVASCGELPESLKQNNKKGLPARAIVFIGMVGALLAMMGSLATLVEAASLIFLFTFAVVNILSFYKIKRHRWVFAAGAVGAIVASIALVWRLITNSPIIILLLGIVIFITLAGRHFLFRRMGDPEDSEK